MKLTCTLGNWTGRRLDNLQARFFRGVVCKNLSVASAPMISHTKSIRSLSMLKKLITYCLLFCLPSLAAAKIVFISNRDAGNNIYVMDDDGSNVQRLTFTEFSQFDSGPIWSPDGTRIAFHRNVSKNPRSQQTEVFIMDPDSSNVQQLTDDHSLDGSCTWSPDGTRIAFTSTRNKGFDIYAMDILTREVDQLTHNPGNGQRDPHGHPMANILPTSRRSTGAS